MRKKVFFSPSNDDSLVGPKACRSLDGPDQLRFVWRANIEMISLGDPRMLGSPSSIPGKDMIQSTILMNVTPFI